MSIKEFTKQFTDDSIDFIEVDRRVYSVDPELNELRKKIDKNINRRPKHLGSFLGETIKRKFKPGFPLLDWISKRTNRKAIVDDNGAWLFLCGRDMFDTAIVRRSVNTGPVIVENRQGDMLGYGLAKKRGNLAIMNVLDRGDFLRREKR